ncbi:sodium/potassium-transporting ATPase subunit beta-1-like isoform X2 [Dendronephthya gigantea]|uniref:sodium/potassium-transporting ATPase subunit beta-1-like isoform X2 n=1 Tax=Dendronephthya gigantea TaxID=151771 RepID=UPI00106AC8E5|nr:sodium/potassium-transporting ATPase subunit beta-1-like isoform X2 [Dendronephthya gigantea]
MDEQEKLTYKQKGTIMYNNFRVFLYNKEKGEVMGRNAESWGKIGLFFFVYYSCLAAFFAAMFAIAFSTMPEIKDGPKYTSFIADKPLLLVYPDGIGSWKNSSVGESIKKRYDDFLDGYEDTQCYLKRKCVAGDGYRPENEDKQCGFNLTSLGPCAPDHASGFGYYDRSPCLYLRLSKIYGWKPEPASNSKSIGLRCDGDKNTKITYHPGEAEAFPISFWPFRGESGFRTPIAAIQVSGNKGSVKIKCSAIADNIELSETYKLRKGAYGQVEFTVAAPPTA